MFETMIIIKTETTTLQSYKFLVEIKNIYASLRPIIDQHYLFYNKAKFVIIGLHINYITERTQINPKSVKKN